MINRCLNLPNNKHDINKAITQHLRESGDLHIEWGFKEVRDFWYAFIHEQDTLCDI